MRPDMSKVIVERPRINRGYGPKGGRDKQIGHDLMPSKEGMKKPYLRGYNNKQLNENLSPLKRFLESRVGRRWDDVYSEISENLKPSNAVQQHVRDHVDDFVATKVTIGKDGGLYVAQRWSGLVPLNESWKGLYVDPTDGILKRNTPRAGYYQRIKAENAARRKEEAAKRRDLPGGTVLLKMDGVWYEILTRPIPPVVVHRRENPDGTVSEWKSGGSAFDILLKKTVSIGERPAYAYRDRNKPWKPITTHAYGRRQLSREELRKFDLQNG